MTQGDTAPSFPAPGSAVPGAPPPLKRALTPADGVPMGPPPAQSGSRDAGLQGSVAPQAADASTSRWPTSLLIAAVAMLGISVGLELAGLLSGRSRRPPALLPRKS